MTPSTPADAIAEAAALIDGMSEVVIVYRNLDDPGEKGACIGIISNIDDPYVQMGLLESAKLGKFLLTFQKATEE